MIIKQVSPSVYSIGGLFTHNDMVSISDEFYGFSNSLGVKRDEYDDTIPPHFCLHKTSRDGIGDNLKLISQSPKIKLAIKKVLRVPFDIHLNRINTNIQFSGQETTFHTDGSGWCWTAVLFTELNWNTNWGGEFVCLTNEGDYAYVPYIPGNLVLFDATQEHKGSCPNFSTKNFRSSVAWTYCKSK